VSTLRWLGTMNHGYALLGCALAIYVPQWYEITHTPLFLNLLALSVLIELGRYALWPLFLAVYSARKRHHVPGQNENHQGNAPGTPGTLL
jgi:hypothetical protein